jgi:hypothetical protein
MYRVEFCVHLTYRNGITSYRRDEQFPFAPFVGIDILDDSLDRKPVVYLPSLGETGRLVDPRGMPKHGQFSLLVSFKMAFK